MKLNKHQIRLRAMVVLTHRLHHSYHRGRPRVNILDPKKYNPLNNAYAPYQSDEIQCDVSHVVTQWLSSQT